jgi:predicted GNAT family N-acyltransferase
VRRVELDEVTGRQWRELVGDEPEPWGGVAEGMVWREKQRHVGIRAPDGRLVALAGAVLADVEVDGAPVFQVVGIGGVFVARSARGRGLTATLLEGLLAEAEHAGPERAMLFCRPQLMDLYRKFAFGEIRDPVWAAQPGGRIEMPLRAMWRPLSAGTAWPAGRVDLHGLPF